MGHREYVEGGLHGLLGGQNHGLVVRVAAAVEFDVGHFHVAVAGLLYDWGHLKRVAGGHLRDGK